MALSKHLPFGAAALLTLALGTDSLAQQRGDFGGWGMGPGMMGNWGMGWAGLGFMLVFWILVIVGLVFLIKLLIQTTAGGKQGDRTGQKAMDILRERYARGEINKEEFETIKQELNS